MRAQVRTTRGQIFVGHWVQIRNIASRQAGNNILAQLRAGGLGDAYLVDDEDGLTISLGLFGNISNAQQIERQAKSLGLNAEIIPRTNEGTHYYVDIALPPGRGASAIIDQYGEEKVALRDDATCPQSN